jgi:hypothetical protein
MTRWWYGLYDLILQSPLELDLMEASKAGAEAWTLSPATVAEACSGCVHDLRDFDGGARLTVWWPRAGELIFSYGHLRVCWSGRDREIRVDMEGENSLPPGVFLERVVAPIATILERPRFVALHASAVEDPRGRAWAILGESGSGKSTAALGLLRQGWSLLADDLVLVDTECAEMWPAVPALRLVDGPERVEEAICSTYLEAYGKYLHRFSSGIVAGSRPLEGILALKPRPGISTCTRLRGWEAARRVLAQSFDLTAGPAEWKAQRFSSICSLTRQTPLWVIAFERAEGAPRQVQAIVEHAEAWP